MSPMFGTRKKRCSECRKRTPEEDCLPVYDLQEDIRLVCSDCTEGTQDGPKARRARTLVLALVGLALLAGVGWQTVPVANADQYGPGCQTVRWGVLGSKNRTICDGAIQADGSWLRKRTVWEEAGSRPASCRWIQQYMNHHWECNEAFSWPRKIVAQEQYVVFPHNVLADEPGHIA